jgi:hypothetical protein
MDFPLFLRVYGHQKSQSRSSVFTDMNNLKSRLNFQQRFPAAETPYNPLHVVEHVE